jgi:hypothetical protein
VPRKENAELYAKYKGTGGQTPKVHFVGRLATYKYYNMDQIVAQALTTYGKIAGMKRVEAVAHSQGSPARVSASHNLFAVIWFNLNGEWEFAFDDANEGLNEGWQDGRELPQRIIVPFAYQTELSGINDKSIHEVVWYARSFELPDEFYKRDLLLNFGAVDYACTVWVNGQEVGHNRGGHVPFQFDIAPYLQPGENRLTVRVEDRQDPEQPRGKQSHHRSARSIDYYCTTGIWQTVWLEPVPPIRIEELRVITHAKRNLLELTVFLHAPSAAWRIEVEVLEEGKRVAIGEDHTAVATGRLVSRFLTRSSGRLSRRISTICRSTCTTAINCLTKLGRMSECAASTARGQVSA